jgi:beta-lactamase regulating signal transducer with metallopeptidase domain
MCQISQEIKIKNEAEKKYYEDRLKELIKKELDIKYDAPSSLTTATLVVAMTAMMATMLKNKESVEVGYVQMVIFLVGIVVVVAIVVFRYKSSKGKNEIETEIASIRRALEAYKPSCSPQS